MRTYRPLPRRSVPPPPCPAGREHCSARQSPEGTALRSAQRPETPLVALVAYQLNKIFEDGFKSCFHVSLISGVFPAVYFSDPNGIRIQPGPWIRIKKYNSCSV
jgi:hypothetical protein